MKIFIQATEDSPKDFVQIDSSEWARLSIRPYAVSVQGVTFSADWYSVIHQPYGCDVITLHDDPRWDPEPIAHVWQFRHIERDWKVIKNEVLRA